MISSETRLTVNYYETDAMGYAHHSNYIRYFETARTEMFKKLGISYAKMEENGVMMPVTHVECRYIRPARFDETITICVVIKQLPISRMHLEYEVINENRRKMCEGSVSLAYINRHSRRPCRAPEDVISILRPYFAQEI